MKQNFQFILVCFLVLGAITLGQSANSKSLTAAERKAVVKALHTYFAEEKEWKFVVRVANRIDNWALLKVRPQKPNNQYETMLILVKKSGKIWEILEIADPTSEELGEDSFAATCKKMHPKVPTLLFQYK